MTQDLGSRGSDGGAGGSSGATGTLASNGSSSATGTLASTGSSSTTGTLASTGSSGGGGAASTAVSGATTGAGGSSCDGGACTAGPTGQLVTGDDHSCAIVGAGVKCWGYDAWGVLGDDSQPGTGDDSQQPVDVKGLTGVAALAAGNDSTCALTAAGAASCWGHNTFGNLGSGAAPEARAPVGVTGLMSGVHAITMGSYWGCARLVAGETRCWGENASNVITTDPMTIANVPVDRAGLPAGIVALALGNSHACALLSMGGVECWGNDEHGELGDGAWTARDTPVPVNGLSSGVIAVAAGDQHTCVVTTTGGVKCWGENSRGQLGNGQQKDSNVPVDVVGLSSGVASVAAGTTHTCVVMAAGGVKCWGENGSGRLGSGKLADSSVPVDVVGLTGALEVSAGDTHTCARTDKGVECWGNNDHQQLGFDTGVNNYALVPGVVQGL